MNKQTESQKNFEINSIHTSQEDDNKLLQELKKFRLIKAKEKKIPPYCIFHDKTLYEIIDKKPIILSELKRIYGIGNKTIEQYGEEIIKIIKKYKQKISEINQPMQKPSFDDIENKTEQIIDKKLEKNNFLKKISNIASNRAINKNKNNEQYEKKINSTYDEAVVSVDKLLEYEKSVKERDRKRQKENLDWGDGGVY